MPSNQQNFNFQLSLSVLNHLGRNLYRNFITVLGEAISNSWDAGATNVWIDIDKGNSRFSIKDDGIGMTADDFQEKFLKIGYSKRKNGEMSFNGKRPFIGAKGIGKLALLSCADRISIYTKTKITNYVGGVIDNGELDVAITSDLEPQDYELESLDFSLIDKLSTDHKNGTIIVFQNIKEEMRNSESHIRKILAMSFKFSLLDDDFNIHINGQTVTISDLKDLAQKTEFVWLVNEYHDDFVDSFSNLEEEATPCVSTLPLKGFLATVVKPRDAKIDGTDERASVDLFVNGRLREKNILRHIPTQRILESYLYGQIHYDEMDGNGNDPFTSSREGILESDPRFKKLLNYLKKTLIPQVMDEWDEKRLRRNKEGDDENERLSRKKRKAKSFISEAEKEYSPNKGESQKREIDKWLSSLHTDAEFNVSAYVDCFLTENLLRKFIKNQSIGMNNHAQSEIDKWKSKEEKNLKEANISYNITQKHDDLCYLGMDSLSVLSEGGKNGTNGHITPLCQDHIVYRPIRNAVGHTSLLTREAKKHLDITLANIKGRVNVILKKVKETK